MKTFKININQSLLYIVTNIFVSLVGFVRSFVFMRWLNMEDLGIISLSLTLMQFLSFLQLGLFNGGFRLLCYENSEEKNNVNNLVYSYIVVISGIVFILYFISYLTGIDLVLSKNILIVSLIGGLIMLLNNWLMNSLIALGKLLTINILNLISVFISLLFLPSVFYCGINAALFVTIIQPIIFAAIVIIKVPELRFSAFNFNINLVKKILSVGFIPFLSGIFFMINLQVERWSIAKILGTEALGNFYLVSLFNTLSLLIPNSINNIFFPKIIKSYNDKDIPLFKKIIKNNTIAFFTYNVLLVLGTSTLFENIVVLIFPNHIKNICYVYYYLPGIVMNSMTYVFTQILNASLKLNLILCIDLLTTISFVVTIGIIYHYNHFSLESICIVRSILYSIVFFVYFFTLY